MSDLKRYGSDSMEPGGGESGPLVRQPDGTLAKSVDPVLPGRIGSPSRLTICVAVASILAAVAVGAAVYGGGSGASGSTSGSAAAHGILAASASDSAAASSVAFTVSAVETTSGAVSTLVSGSGSFDLSRRVGRMTASIPALSSLVGGGSQGSVTLISDGTDVYVNVPALSSLTGGKTWLEASIASLASMSGVSTGSSSLSALTDPSSVLGLLGSLGGTVTRVGTVQLDGVQTTEYQTTISVASIASELDHRGHLSTSESAAASALEKLGVPTIPVTAWVGSDGLLRQVSLSVDLSHATPGSLFGALGSSSSGSSVMGSASEVNITVGLSDYGQPVSVTVPPASDTTNLNAIISSVHGAFSKLGGVASGMAARA